MAGTENQNTIQNSTANTTANEDGRTMNDSTAAEALLLAIDGPSGTGKSTVSRAVAEHLGAKYLDTGAMYRVATLWVLRKGIDPADEDAVVAATADLPLAVSDDPRSTEVLLDGEELGEADRGRLGLPVFVKPARGGSSIGISKVDSWDEFDAALELARAHDAKVIVEKGIVGAEVECGVLQRPDGELVASTPAQLTGTEDSDEGFYGFDTKYLDDVVTAQIPAQLPAETIAQVQELSKLAFRSLGCDGLTRVDFFVTADGPVLNEVNTMPGFTPISMYPQMFAASGVAYPELLDTLVQRALVARR